MLVLQKYLPLTFVPLVLILWGLFVATPLLTSSFKSFAQYQSAYTAKSTPGNEGDALTTQLIIIVADGLRLDGSRQMKNLNALRAKGADRIMRVGLPSLSLPGWTVIGTGAWPEQHGQTTNYHAHPTPMDSIFQAARRKGLTTALAGSPSWNTVFRGQIDTVLVEPGPPDAHQRPDEVRKQDDAIEADALKILTEKNPNLLLIHFNAPDNASHGFGALSAENARAVQDVDARLGRLLTAIDLTRTTVLVTADHGQIDRGGHGGSEEAVVNVGFVAAGSGIKPGQYELAMQADIAPTAAVLLGTSIPTDSQGDVMFDLLDMSSALKAQRAVDWAQEIVDRYTTIAKVIDVGTIEHRKLAEASAALAEGNDEAAFAAAQSEVTSTRDAVFAFREGRLQQERLIRTPVFLLLLLPLGVYTWFMNKMNWEFKRPLLGALIYFIVYYTWFFGRGYSFSLSVFNENDQFAAWLTARTIDSILSLVLVSVVMGVLSRGDDKYDTVLNMINAAFFVAAGLWLQVSIFYWLYDFTWPWFLPDQALAFKYYLDLVQTGAFMLKDPPIPIILLLPLVAVGVHGLTERISDFRQRSGPPTGLQISDFTGLGDRHAQ